MYVVRIIIASIILLAGVILWSIVTDRSFIATVIVIVATQAILQISVAAYVVLAVMRGDTGEDQTADQTTDDEIMPPDGHHSSNRPGSG